MKSNQFVHVNSYAQASPRTTKKDKSKTSQGTEMPWSISEILDEACRTTKKAIPHVTTPLPAIWNIGSRVVIETRVRAYQAQAMRPDGKRKLRVTSRTLACAAVSLNAEDIAIWPAYRDASIAYFIKKYGKDRVVGVIEHIDEPNPHIHIYLAERDGLPFGLHPGKEAAAIARAHVDNHVGTAYRGVMRVWLDEFFAAVSEPFGLARVGPKRERVSRIEHLGNRDAAALKKKAAQEAKEILARAAATSKAAAAELAAVNKAKSELIDVYRHQQRLTEAFNASPPGAMQARIAELEAENARLRGVTETKAKASGDAAIRAQFAAEKKAKDAAAALLRAQEVDRRQKSAAEAAALATTPKINR